MDLPRAPQPEGDPPPPGSPRPGRWDRWRKGLVWGAGILLAAVLVLPFGVQLREEAITKEILAEIDAEARRAEVRPTGPVEARDVTTAWQTVLGGIDPAAFRTDAWIAAREEMETSGRVPPAVAEVQERHREAMDALIAELVKPGRRHLRGEGLDPQRLSGFYALLEIRFETARAPAPLPTDAPEDRVGRGSLRRSLRNVRILLEASRDLLGVDPTMPSHGWKFRIIALKRLSPLVVSPWLGAEDAEECRRCVDLALATRGTYWGDASARSADEEHRELLRRAGSGGPLSYVTAGVRDRWRRLRRKATGNGTLAGMATAGPGVILPSGVRALRAGMQAVVAAGRSRDGAAILRFYGSLGSSDWRGPKDAPRLAASYALDWSEDLELALLDSGLRLRRLEWETGALPRPDRADPLVPVDPWTGERGSARWGPEGWRLELGPAEANRPAEPRVTLDYGVPPSHPR